MIKDAKGRFADNPIWSDGWGWALYKPDDRGKNVATNYRIDCLGCHVPAKTKDWVYTEAYPTLSSE
jgi:hypothetical protein